MWQASLGSEKLPDCLRNYYTNLQVEWKPSNPALYQSVALTKHLTKIFERILKESMVE